VTPTLGGSAVKVYPLTPDRWADLDTLFGTNGREAVAGACGGD